MAQQVNPNRMTLSFRNAKEKERFLRRVDSMYQTDANKELSRSKKIVICRLFALFDPRHLKILSAYSVCMFWFKSPDKATEGCSYERTAGYLDEVRQALQCIRDEHSYIDINIKSYISLFK